MQTGNFQLVREINRRLIFNLIRSESEISRARLVQITGLGKATVSAVVDELIERRLVVEGQTATGAVGRRPVLLGLNPDGPLLAAVQIGSAQVRGGLTDLQGRVISATVRSCPAEAGASTIKLIGGMLRDLSDTAARNGRSALGAGISVPGILNPPGDVVLSAPELGWRDVSLLRLLDGVVDFPIWLGDEAKMAALAEAALGAGIGADTLLYLGLGETVGAGLIQRGRLAGGTHAGHITVLPDGPVCWCGNRGCLGMLVGRASIRRRIEEQLATGGLPDRPPDDNTLLSWLTDLALAGDTGAIRIYREAAKWLGIGLANLIDLYQPELVLLGGWISEAPAFVLEYTREEAKSRALPALFGPVRIASAGLREDAELSGAAVMALAGVLGAQSIDDLS